MRTRSFSSDRPVFVDVFGRMGLEIYFRMLAVAPHLKNGRLPCGNLCELSDCPQLKPDVKQGRWFPSGRSSTPKTR